MVKKTYFTLFYFTLLHQEKLHLTKLYKSLQAQFSFLKLIEVGNYLLQTLCLLLLLVAALGSSDFVPLPPPLPPLVLLGCHLRSERNVNYQYFTPKRTYILIWKTHISVSVKKYT